MRGEVHILVHCPIDTLQWGSTHSALFVAQLKGVRPNPWWLTPTSPGSPQQPRTSSLATIEVKPLEAASDSGLVPLLVVALMSMSRCARRMSTMVSCSLQIAHIRPVLPSPSPVFTSTPSFMTMFTLASSPFRQASRKTSLTVLVSDISTFANVANVRNSNCTNETFVMRSAKADTDMQKAHKDCKIKLLD